MNTNDYDHRLGKPSNEKNIYIQAKAAAFKQTPIFQIILSAEFIFVTQLRKKARIHNENYRTLPWPKKKNIYIYT